MGTSTSAPKQVIREMAQNDLITNVDAWFDALEARNLSSLTYDQDLAKKVYESAKKYYSEKPYSLGCIYYNHDALRCRLCYDPPT